MKKKNKKLGSGIAAIELLFSFCEKGEEE